MAKIKVLDSNITVLTTNEEDYISLTDIANSKDCEQRAADFKVVEFDHFKKVLKKVF